MKKVDEKTFPDLSRLTNRDDSLFWQDVESKKVLDAFIFDIWFNRRKSTDGREGTFVQIKSRDWVNIVPVFTGADGVERFVMEKQFRHGSSKVTLEFPAGLIEQGEKPEEAALRELEEECGIRAHSLKLIGKVNTNPAFMSNTANFFLATDLEYLGTRKFDPNEQIETVSVPVAQVMKEAGTSEKDNGVTVISCFYYLREKCLV